LATKSSDSHSKHPLPVGNATHLPDLSMAAATVIPDSSAGIIVHDILFVLLDVQLIAGTEMELGGTKDTIDR
jgi:hypothetical protein